MKNQLLKTIICLTCILQIGSNLLAQSPTFIWAKGITGGFNFFDYPASVQTDLAGNVYSLGQFAGTFDFNPGANVTLLSSNQGTLYLTKYNSAGNFIWAIQLGIKHPYITDYRKYMHVDGSGNTYISSLLRDTANFTTSSGLVQLTPISLNPLFDMFVCKINTNGIVSWVKQIGGISGNIIAGGLTTDQSGNVYATGAFSNTVDFDPGTSTNFLNADSTDMFILKLNSSGNLGWVKQIVAGTSGKVQGLTIAIDKSSNLCIAGVFSGTVDFDPGAAIHNLTATYTTSPNPSSGNHFILKLNSSGNFIFVKGVVGSGNIQTSDIAIDTSNNIITSGVLTGTLDFDPSSSIYNLSANGYYDPYILKLDSSGNFDWAKVYGSDSTAGCSFSSLAIDPAGNIYSSGYFSDVADFDPSPTATYNLTTSFSNINLYVTKINPSGNFDWAISLGGSTSNNYSTADGICLDTAGNIYVTGLYEGNVDFDPGIGIYNLPIPLSSEDGIYNLKLGKGAVGINEIRTTSFTNVYPNPSNGDFTVLFPEFINKGSIEIYDSKGNKIFNEQIHLQNEKKVRLINISPGIYLVNVFNGEKNYNRKISIEK